MDEAISYTWPVFEDSNSIEIITFALYCGKQGFDGGRYWT